LRDRRKGFSSPTYILPLPKGGGGFWGIPTYIFLRPLGGEGFRRKREKYKEGLTKEKSSSPTFFLFS